VKDKIIKSAYGLTFSKSYIFDRVLSITQLLCWCPKDIGLTRTHLVNGQEFTSKKEADAYVSENGISADEIDYSFKWVQELDGLKGIERESFLRSKYWPSREQVMNTLVDSVIQSNLEDATVLFSQIIGAELNKLQFLDVNTNNTVRKYSGQPDTVLWDEEGKKIIFIEIKIGCKPTKYLFEQHLKYIGLNALTKCKELFPEYQIYNVLLASGSNFISNTKGIEQLNPVTQQDGSVLFDYTMANVEGLSPAGCGDVNSLIDARIAKLKGAEDEEKVDHVKEFNFRFYDWNTFFSLIPSGELKDGLAPLMISLKGS